MRSAQSLSHSKYPLQIFAKAIIWFISDLNKNLIVSSSHFKSIKTFLLLSEKKKELLSKTYYALHDLSTPRPFPTLTRHATPHFPTSTKPTSPNKRPGLSFLHLIAFLCSFKTHLKTSQSIPDCECRSVTGNIECHEPPLLCPAVNKFRVSILHYLGPIFTVKIKKRRKLGTCGLVWIIMNPCGSRNWKRGCRKYWVGRKLKSPV